MPFAVATPFVAFALTAAITPTYESSADVLIDRKGHAISGLRDLEWYYYDASRAIKTQVELARLPEIEQRVQAAAERDGLSASGLFGRSSVTEDGLTDLMTFHVRDGEPELAAQLATLYAGQYVAHRRALDTRALRRALAVVEAQLASSRALGADPSTYAQLVQRQQQLQTGLATVAANTKLVRPAVEAPRVAPLLWHDTLLALGLGLIVGLGLAALANVLDARARTADEISEQLGLPLVGRIPFVRRAGRTSTGLALLRGEDGSSAEAIRLLRANLELDSLGREHSVVMVTSSVAGEGKSTTVSSLAVALALAGRDVVLVDLDLRRPVLSRIFDLPKAPGIVELARGIATIADAVHVVSLDPPGDDASGRAPVESTSGRGTLRVVPAGNTLATDPAEVVASRELPAALDSLRELADVVLVDSPPLLQTGDALAMSSFVDGIVVIAHTKRYRRHFAPALERLLALSRATPLGLVVIGEPGRLEPARRYPAGERRELERTVRALGGA
jgi:succinoglycan biosynthesis transport protein ExoP